MHLSCRNELSTWTSENFALDEFFRAVLRPVDIERSLTMPTSTVFETGKTPPMPEDGWGPGEAEGEP